MSGPVIGVDLGGTKVAVACLDGVTLGEPAVQAPSVGITRRSLLSRMRRAVSA